MAEASGGENSLLSNVAAPSDQSDGTAGVESQKEKPICILCLGMAGSGKTTFVQVILLFALRLTTTAACASSKPCHLLRSW